ncbi:MAG: PAS-domain containing protein [Acetobacteraceae bacterium]|nr:PAS-domain containing protein [Acetobacteraceae bacterium]
MNLQEDLRLRALEALPCPIAVFDAGRRLVLSNAALARVLSADPSALPLGLPLADALHLIAYCGLLSRGEAELLLASLGAEPEPRSHALSLPDGRRFEMQFRAMPGGGLLLLLLDRTDEARARVAAEAEVARLMDVVARLGSGVAIYDAEARLRLSNPAYASLIGLPPSVTLPGRSLTDLVAEQAQRGEFGPVPVEAMVQAAQARDRSRRRVHERRRPNGAVIRFENQPLPEGGWLSEVTDVTLERRAELEASRRAALHDAVMSVLPIGVLVFGPDRRVAMVNPAYNRIVADSPVAPGETMRELLLRRARQGQYGPGDPVQQVDEIIASLAQPKTYMRERPGGTITLHRSVPLPDGGQVVVVSDETQLHKAQEEARRRNEILTAMIENTRHGIALFDKDGVTVAANTLAEEFCGLPKGSFRPGAHINDLRALQLRDDAHAGSPETRRWLEDRLTRPLRAPERYTRRRTDGRVIEVVTDQLADGGYVRSFTNVTALFEAEEEARRRAEVTQALLESVRHTLALYGPDRRCIAANGLVSELAGFSTSDEVIGVPFEEVIARQAKREWPDDPARQAAFREQMAALDRSVPIRYQRRLEDGRVFDVASDPTPNGGFAVCISDITPLVQAEEEAQRRAERLQAMISNSRQGVLLYDADDRLVAANDLAGELTGIPDLTSRLGIHLHELLAEQARRGRELGLAEADEIEVELVRLDRTRPQRGTRPGHGGRVLDVASDPVPGGGFVVSIADVTPLAAAKAEAEQSAAALRATLNATQHGVVLFSADARVVVANDLMARIAGFGSAAEMVGLTAAEVIANQARHEYGKDIDPAPFVTTYTALDRSQRHRYTRRTGDGRVVSVVSDPMAEGGYVLTVTDITALVTAQETAERQAAVMRAALNASRHGLALFGGEGGARIVAANELFAQMTGFSSGGAMLGLDMPSVIRSYAAMEHPGDAAAAARLAQRLEAAALEGRFQHRRRDGRVLDVANDPTADGGFSVSLSDVTPLVAAETAARERAAHLTAMLDNIRHGIALFDAQARIVAVNPKMYELLSLPADALAPGRTLAEMVAALKARGEYGEGEEAERQAEAIVSRDRRQAFRAVRERGNGRTLDAVSDPTPDGGFVLTFTDITEDRAVRAELERARQAAEAASLAKSRFLATMSHELRTPLNAVIGFSEALKAGIAPDQTAEFAEAIHEAGRHLLSLIDDILDVTRAEAGALPVLEERVDAARAVQDAARLMGPAADAGRLRLIQEVEPGLPALRGDGRRLHQILLNLLSNAVKFTPEGGEVRIAARREAGGVTFLVTDSGIGISPADLPRVFEPFMQADSSLSRRFGGSGLGLPLSRVLAEAQGATLTLDSAPAGGTSVRLHFPASRLWAPE